MEAWGIKIRWIKLSKKNPNDKIKDNLLNRAIFKPLLDKIDIKRSISTPISAKITFGVSKWEIPKGKTTKGKKNSKKIKILGCTFKFSVP